MSAEMLYWWCITTQIPRGRGRGGDGCWGTPDFKWRRWLKDFWGFEIFDSAIFWGQKIWVAWLKEGFFGYWKLSEDFFVLQWNLNIIKCQRTGKICSLQWGFVILRYFSICFTITGVKKIVCYTEDFVIIIEVRYIKISRFHCISFYYFWKFISLGNSAWDFLGVNWSRDVLGFGSLPSFNHPGHLKSVVPPPPNLVVLLIGCATWEICFNQSRSTTQIWVVMRYQYGISALFSQTSICGETSGGVA